MTREQLETLHDESLTALVEWNLRIEKLRHRVRYVDASDPVVKKLTDAEEAADRERKATHRYFMALRRA